MDRTSVIVVTICVILLFTWPAAAGENLPHPTAAHSTHQRRPGPGRRTDERPQYCSVSTGAALTGTSQS